MEEGQLLAHYLHTLQVALTSTVVKQSHFISKDHFIAELLRIHSLQVGHHGLVVPTFIGADGFPGLDTLPAESLGFG